MQRDIVCIVAISLISGCTTTRLVIPTESQSLASQIAAGDSGEVEKRDGNTLKFKVLEVSSEGLRGNDLFVAAADIRSVGVTEEPHPALAAFVVLLAGAAIWMLVDPKDVCGDGPAKPCEDDGP